MGLPMENDLLATTSEQIKEPESKFGTQKNLLSLTIQSKNVVLIDHVICHMTIFLKILQLTKLVMDLRKEGRSGYIEHRMAAVEKSISFIFCQ